MKKTILFTLMIFLLVSLQLSAAYTSDLTRGIALQGAYEDVLDINFEEIAAQTQAYIIGMPFNIMDSSVYPTNNGRGRVIANWSVLTNTDFSIKLTCNDKLHHMEKESTPLDFTLTFTYKLSYFIDGVPNEGETKYFSFNTADPSTFQQRLMEDGTVPDTGSFIGSVEGLVYFVFNENDANGNDQAEIINDIAQTPPGNYVAEVIVEIIPE